MNLTWIKLELNLFNSNWNKNLEIKFLSELNPPTLEETRFSFFGK